MTGQIAEFFRFCPHKFWGFFNQVPVDLSVLFGAGYVNKIR